jgi:hypothetical protein
VAFERLFVAVQRQCRSIGVSSSLEDADAVFGTTTGTSLEQKPAGSSLSMAPVFLRRALSVLKQRPVYFNHSLRDIARLRKELLKSRFLGTFNSPHPHVLGGVANNSSTGGRTTSTSTPTHSSSLSHDVVRYVGDQLAWIHEQTANEKDLLMSFLGLKDQHGREQALAQITDAGADEGEDNSLISDVANILDFVVEGLAEPFKNRVFQENYTVVRRR